YQVKVRGFRIELGEIEKALLKIEHVLEAVVLTREGKTEDRYLCAYIVCKTSDVKAADIKKSLSHSLPEYMVPAYIIPLEQLPTNSNGKVDRKALPEPKGSIHTGVKFEGPRNRSEEKLVDIWRQVLG